MKKSKYEQYIGNFLKRILDRGERSASVIFLIIVFLSTVLYVSPQTVFASTTSDPQNETLINTIVHSLEHALESTTYPLLSFVSHLFSPNHHITETSPQAIVIKTTNNENDKNVLAANTTNTNQSPQAPSLPQGLTLDTLSTNVINLLHNSSFEQQSNGQPRDWNYQLDSNMGNTFISQEGNRSGSFGLKFVGGGTGNVGISQPNVKTIPGRTYTFSLYVKSTNAPVNTILRFGFWNEYLNQEGQMKVIPLPSTEDWTRYSFTVTTPGLITDPKNEFPLIEVEGLTSGAVYLDDAQLTEGNIPVVYDTTQAYTSSQGIGDGSVLFSTGGDIFPAITGSGQLGSTTNQFTSLNLTNASIDSNGNFTFKGGGTVNGGLNLGSLTINGNTLFSSTTSALQVSNGGTGATSLTQYGVLYGNGTSALSALTPGTNGYILQSNGTGIAPSWVAQTGIIAGSVGFNNITSGTNTQAAMVIGSGASLAFSAFPAGSIPFINSSNQLAQDNSNLFWDATNHFLGIGTTTPYTPLHILNTNSATTTTALTLGNALTANGTGSKIAFNLSPSSSIVNAYIAAVRTNSPSVGAAYLSFAPSTNGTPVEALRLSEIGGAGFQTSAIGNSALVVNQPNSSGDIFSASQAGSTKFVISNAGNVGIGTTTPSDLLQVIKNVNSDLNVTFQQNFSGKASTIIANANSTYARLLSIDSNTGQGWYMGLNGSDNFTLLDSITSNTPLTVSTGTPTNALFLSSAGAVSINNNLGGNGSLVVNQPNSSGDIFSASQSGSTKFVITQAGNVGIGTASVDAPLYVQKTNSGADQILLKLVNADTSTNTSSSIAFTNTSSPLTNTHAKISAIRTNAATSGDTDLAFSVIKAGTLTEKLRVVANGGLGILTSSVGNGALVINQPNASGDIFSASQSGSTKFVINNSGNVGVGTTTPNNLIQVANLINFNNSVYSTFLGYQAGNINTANNNTALGYQALLKLSGASNTSNTAIGAFSMDNAQNGYSNTAVGFASLANGSSGYQNTAVGLDTLWGTTGTNNTALGYTAGYNPENITGSNNTFIGALTGPTATNLTNASAFGSYATVSENNAIVLGSINGINGATASTGVGIGVQSPIGALDVEGAFAGQSLMTLNYTGTDQNIFTASVSGSTKFVINNNGNVGIGTTTPATPLDVFGSSFLDGWTTVGGGGTFQTAAGLTVMSSFDSNPSVWIEPRSTQTGDLLDVGGGPGSINSNIFAIKAAGFVAIGNTLPGNGALVLNQPNSSGDIFSASQSGSTKFVIGNTGAITAKDYTTAGGVFFADGTGLFTQTGAGTSAQCLIGGTTPAWATCATGGSGINYWQLNNKVLSPYNNTLDLAVGGSGTGSAFQVFGGANGSIPAGTASTSGNLSFTNANAKVDLLNNSTLGFYNTVWGNGGEGANPALYIANNGNVGIGTTTPVTSLDIEPPSNQGVAIGTGSYPSWMATAGIYLQGQIYALGGYIVGNSHSINWGQSTASLTGLSNNNTTDYLSFSTNSLERMRINGIGNIGVGTTTPKNKLDVNGSVAIGSYAGTNTAPSNGLLVSGQVGIGTTAPGTGAWNSVLLDVHGEIAISTPNDSGGSPYEIYASGNGAGGTNVYNEFSNWGGSYNWLVSGTDQLGKLYSWPNHNGDDNVTAGGAFSLYSSAANPASQEETIRLAADGKDSPTFFNGGSVGIGNTNPGAALEVTQGRYVGSGTKPIGLFDGSTSFAGLEVNNTGVGDLFTASQSGNTKFVIDNAGNVGIGTTNPYVAKFVIKENGSNQNSLYVVGSGGDNYLRVGLGTNATDDGVLSLYRSSDGVSEAYLSSNGSSYFNGGALGINTTSPLALLDLRGTKGTNNISGLGTIPVASIAGQTSFAGLVVDNSGTGDLFTASSSGLNRFVITQAGNVGINTTTPNYKLDAIDTQNSTSSASITNLSTSDTANTNVLALNLGTATSGTNSRFIQFYAGANSSKNAVGVGRIQLNNGNVAYNTGGADFAEYFSKGNTPLEQGDIVTIDNTGSATLATQKTGAIGIVSTTAGFIGNAPHDPSLEQTKVTVGLVGQLPVKVTTENGTIQPGDLLTLSSTAGVAMKATKAGEMIGRALEGYTNTDSHATGTIQVLINISYADPNLQIALTNTGDLSVNGQVVTTSTNTSGLAVNSTIPSQTTQTTQTTSTGITPDQFSTLSTTVTGLQSQIASMSSQLGKIDDLSKQLADLQKTVNFNQLLSGTSSQSAVLGASITNEDMTVGGKLNVLGRTVLSDLGVTGTFTSGLLSINGMDTTSGTASATINTLTAPLKFQSLATAGIDFENGKITIDTNGNIIINGDVTAKTVKADQYQAKGSGDNASVGEAAIPAGQTQVVIKTTAVIDKSRIFVTSETDGSGALYVISKTIEKSFAVKVDQPFSKDVKFSWWIVNGE